MFQPGSKLSFPLALFRFRQPSRYKCESRLVHSYSRRPGARKRAEEFGRRQAVCLDAVGERGRGGVVASGALAVPFDEDAGDDQEESEGEGDGQGDEDDESES